MSVAPQPQPSQPGALAGNPQTTAAGVVAAVSTLLMLVVHPLVDGDPATAPNWAVAVPIVMTTIGLVLAKDAKAKGEPPAGGAA